MLFDKEVILFDQSVTSNIDALTLLANQLNEVGSVNDQYKDAILKRESEFPTGLQTSSVGIAIPHTDADKVVEPQIGFMRLKNPVKFLQMGDNSEVQVKMIFMLALKQSEDQLTMLQTLMNLFQNEEAMSRLQELSSKKEFLEIMKQVGIIK
ncbi:PTS sugar transporter subunit IIA [Lapidilactobacillus dextrinicus]|uniref:PTS sugar transporter subunit IIA n=1 Tax=Lapidilactobacillus dextrinicus TaxID=51664 RepID=UPI0022E6AD25|nr:PTS sugar transporter subunit IIA [Lapidilactobacillus dextrinicus]